MSKNMIALNLVTVIDSGKVRKERERLVSCGFSVEEADACLDEKLSKSSIPPVAFQRITGVYAIVRREQAGEKGEPASVITRSFGAAGDNEGALVNFAFRVFAGLEPSRSNPPTVITGNGGYALQILLAKANERTLAERTGEKVREGDRGFISDSYGKTLALFLDNSDKFGVNYTNKYSKVLFDPMEFDSQFSIPSHVPGARMFRDRDWNGTLLLARTGCEDIALRSFNILDNRNLVRENQYEPLPSPGEKCAFVVETGKPNRAVRWEDVEGSVKAEIEREKNRLAENSFDDTPDLGAQIAI